MSLGPLAAVVIAYLACLGGGTPGACEYADELAARNRVSIDDLRATIEAIERQGFADRGGAAAPATMP